MKIEVSQADIDAVTPGDWMDCPVERAIHRTLPELKIEAVSSALELSDGTAIPLPPIVWDFILHFNSELPVKPFSFELPIDSAIAGRE